MIFYLMLMFTVCAARNPFPDHTDDTFQKECLSATNSYRSKHHAVALHIDQKAVDYAKSRCQLVSQSKGLSNHHAGLKGYGENLWLASTSNPSLKGCKDAIDSWYKEVKDYDYNNPDSKLSQSAGHFTQLIWKASTGVGCARCGGKDENNWYETYVTCNYSPQGNVGGQYKQNVSPP